MPDREKVIKGVHDARRYLEDREWVDKSVGVHIDALNDALALLKEQEIVPYIDIDEAKCPDCKVKLTRQELLGEDVLFEDFYDYCPRCGKKVKWNE